MFDIVVPTIGRPSLRRLLNSIGRSSGPRPGRIFVVDDRRDRSAPLELGLDADLGQRVTVRAGRAAGPASARNIGWRCSGAVWIAFVDDDVLVGETWLDDLARDLRDLPGDVAASQGRVLVPLPAGRRPTDWERNVAGLATARWITADCAYRRSALLAAGGFDERFRRAYREDADLALRVVARGKRIVRGERRVTHPVGAADWTISVRLQAGNADDALMEALHGRAWRSRAGAPRGAYRQHVGAASAAGIALAACAARRPKVAAIAAAAWALQAVYFAWRRIAPGPRTRGEIAAMLASSVAIPFAAVYHRVRGASGRRGQLADRARAPKPLPRAVLFDRDGTLVVDLPFNRDPDRVEPMPGAASALAMLRAADVPIAVVSNQSGVALGRVTRGDVDALNARIEALLGPLGPVFVCTHGPDDRCRCRKPAPGLLEAAARRLGVRLRDCVVVGDIGADIEAAHAAGARAILVPTAVTRPEEIAAAPLVARDLEHAVRLLLGEEA
ncbi:MAG: hydrolase, HAD-superfamily, subfamily [Candidatus Eremiobacteraeota bacterium]|nr:hydrolase, HAD-superfamily, subfamily [Candidatus Eremiobacteraeota bacterium]